MNPLISLVSETIELIHKAQYNSNSPKFDINKLFNTPQPDQWIHSEQSSLTGEVYYFNKISLLEDLINDIFDTVDITNVSTTVYGTKERFCVTTVLHITFEIGNIVWKKSGTASVYAPTLQHIQMATPLSYTEAKKHAIKQLGDLFGRSLNRITEDKVTPSFPESEKSEIDQEYENFMKELSSIPSKDDAKEFLSKSTFKFNQQLIELVNAKH